MSISWAPTRSIVEASATLISVAVAPKGKPTTVQTLTVIHCAICDSEAVLQLVGAIVTEKCFRFMLLLTLLSSAGLQGHPMSNVSVNHYARIEPSAEAVEILYVLDLAEIPAFELLQKWNVKNGAQREEIERHTAGEARAWVRNLAISKNGRTIEPQLQGTR